MPTVPAQETRKIAVTSSDKSENLIGLCKAIIFVADADCFIDFDRPATTGSLLVKANIVYQIPQIQYTQVHAISNSTANLYFIAIR